MTHESLLEPPPSTLPDDRSHLLAMAPGRLWVQDRGPLSSDEPPLLLIHSLLVTGWDFRRFADPLAAAGRRVLAPDLFGCGNSDRPAAQDTSGYSFEWHAELLARMLDRLGVPVVDVLGHGYGGSIGIHLARRLTHPRGQHRVKLRRLIVIAPYLFPVEAPIDLPGPMPLVRRAWSWVGFAPLVFRTAFRRADLRSFLQRSLAHPERLDTEGLCNEVDVYWDRLCRTGGLEAVQAMLGQLHALEQRSRDGVRERLHDAARSLTCPSMIVWGDRDAIVPPSMAEGVHQLMRGAELRVIEDCGHAPQRERPEALALVLEAFDRRMR